MYSLSLSITFWVSAATGLRDMYHVKVVISPEVLLAEPAAEAVVLLPAPPPPHPANNPADKAAAAVKAAARLKTFFIIFSSLVIEILHTERCVLSKIGLSLYAAYRQALDKIFLEERIGQQNRQNNKHR